MIAAIVPRHGVMLLLIAAVLAPVSAVALDQDDAMSKWAESSEQDRSHLLDQLRAQGGKIAQTDRSSELACMNAAAAVPEHRDLRIGDIAAACAEPPALREPQTDI